MSKMELLDALEAQKLMKQKWKQYCGTPCMLFYFQYPLLGNLRALKLTFFRMDTLMYVETFACLAGACTKHMTGFIQLMVNRLGML